MRVQITARRCDVPQDARDRATSLMERLRKFDDRLQAVELVFEVEKLVHRVEGILSIAGDDTVVATGEGRDFAAAADDLSDKLGKILRRRRSQLRDRARASAGEVAAD